MGICVFFDRQYDFGLQDCSFCNLAHHTSSLKWPIKSCLAESQIWKDLNFIITSKCLILFCLWLNLVLNIQTDKNHQKRTFIVLPLDGAFTETYQWLIDQWLGLKLIYLYYYMTLNTVKVKVSSIVFQNLHIYFQIWYEILSYKNTIWSSITCSFANKS